MPRNNRPSRRASGQPDDEQNGLGRLLSGWKRVEQKRDGEWWVQPVGGSQAGKVYLCPGCRLDITPGVAHVVAWRADGLMGDDASLADRRHWHSHCWRLK
ncbi:hypothetical protein [Microterricola viridarii]|uniref:ATP/GTP-binding protein n=1 Tax=Microterricola viridarii TaxID=412690 RepID=A0A1H1T931_9MICO|nr:hypothetical protein [Microterricola viridarii]SDS56688.1 hypothetical protein SAMN04489834_1718 [Microterricola viridarii]